jgi:hypothetical protein
LGFNPRVSDSGRFGVKFAALQSSQMMLILLIPELLFENYCDRFLVSGEEVHPSYFYVQQNGIPG